MKRPQAASRKEATPCSSTDATHADSPPEGLTWTSFAKATPVLLGGAAAALNFIGQEAYASYLAHWGLHEGMMSLDTGQYVRFGYRAILITLDTFIPDFISKVALATIVIAVAVYILMNRILSGDSSTNSGRLKWMAAAWARVPKMLQHFMASIAMSSLIALVIYVCALGSAVGLLIGPIIGEHAAHQMVLDNERASAIGCQGSRNKLACTVFEKNGVVLGTGIIIASSSSRVAYLDPATQQVHVIKLDDAELRSSGSRLLEQSKLPTPPQSSSSRASAS